MPRYRARCSRQRLSSLFPVLLGWGAGTAHKTHSPVPGSRYPRQEESWGNEIPDILYFTLGTTKACLAAARWTPVRISHVGNMVAPFQRKEGAAAVKDLLPKRSWEKGESISTQFPPLPGRVLGASATTFAACYSLFSFEDFFLLTLPFLGESTSCWAVLHSQLLTTHFFK